jgi:NAD+ kinase
MKKVFVFGKDNKKVNRVKSLISGSGFVISKKNPELVVTVGGDGTYLMCERLFPNTSKLMIRDSVVCYHCDEYNYDDIIEVVKKLKMKKYNITENIKLEAKVKRKKLIATNDIIIRNKNIGEALRFKVIINGKIMYHELIGDGVVVATPFGSTGYFSSITRKSFDKGIGVAYNNCNVKLKHPVLHENSHIKIKILRGEALVGVDNDNKVVSIGKNSVVDVRKYKGKARMLKLKK